jgi:type I restriction enzyme M protein
LAEVTNERGRVTGAAVKHRLKTIRGEAESDEERDILKRCLALIEAESRAGKAVKEAQAALDRAVLARYTTLSEAEIKTLVVEDKWSAGIRAAIDHEVQRLTQQLAGRVRELEERYARPLPALEHDVEEFGAKVESHLRRMGLSP